MNQQLHRLALELLVVSFLNLLFLHGFSLFTLSFRVRKIRGGSKFSLAKGLANLGGSVQSVGVYLACIGIRLVARGLVCLYEPLADFRQRGTRSLFIVPNPSRLNGPAEPGPFSALETHCRHAENVRAHLAP